MTQRIYFLRDYRQLQDQKKRVFFRCFFEKGLYLTNKELLINAVGTFNFISVFLRFKNIELHCSCGRSQKKQSGGEHDFSCLDYLK